MGIILSMQSAPIFHCGHHRLTLNRPHIMGIVNVTPDSFSDGGQFLNIDLAIQHALQLVEEGADILDIGGESTRPGAIPVALDEELSRVIPVIQHLTSLVNVPISIDTYKPAVMQAALDAGASIVNDVCALQEDGAVEVVAKTQAGVCLMHMQGTPQTMQIAPSYQHVVQEVVAFLAGRLDKLNVAGVDSSRILLDPGFGFGKRIKDNIALLQHLSVLTEIGQPLLVGLSRKSILGAIAGADASQKLHAGIAASVIAVMKGASIVRVHDVKATADAFKVLNALEINAYHA